MLMLQRDRQSLNPILSYPLPSACLGKCAVEPHLNVAFSAQVCTAETPDWPLVPVILESLSPNPGASGP